MTDNVEFHQKLRAHRAHVAAVPAALAAARAATIDLHGQPMSDSEPPRCSVSCAHLRTLVAEVDRLTSLEKQLRQDMREEQREFQREARDIAAEATWQERERNSDDGGY